MDEYPLAARTDPSDMRRTLVGIGWMVLSGLLFVGVAAVVKHGVQELPAAESAFIRYVIGLIFLVPMAGAMRKAILSRRQLRLLAIRGLSHSLAVMLWFYAMTRITIAEVTAINYLTPIYITLGAALFLGERIATRRLIAIGFAFAGAMIILRPGIRPLVDGHFAMLFAAVVFSISYLIAKRMADEMPASVVVAMLSISVTICLTPFAMAVWRTPTLAETGWMFLVAIFATAGHYAMTRAFALTPVSVSQPITFLQLIWSVLLGSLFFAEAIDGWVILGGLVIIASATFIAIRETILKRKLAEASASPANPFKSED